jgi:hypothetical protein
MPRNKYLVRAATLKRHVRNGLVSHIEILDDGQGMRVRVHYREHADGAKLRLLTTYRGVGARRFASLDTVWRFLTSALGVHSALIQKEKPP